MRSLSHALVSIDLRRLFIFSTNLVLPVAVLIVVDLCLRYLNTSSSKCMMTLFDLMDGQFREGRDTRVSWKYETGNEMAYEFGLEFAEDLSLPFEIVEVGDLP